LAQNARILSLRPFSGLQKTLFRHVPDLPEGGQSMRRKPDLLWVLVFLFGLGVVTTGYAQSFWERKADTSVDYTMAQQQLQKR
jgi:hypothetical protein